MTRPRRKLTIARMGSLIGANEFLKAAGCAPFFHESLWKEKGGERKSVLGDITYSSALASFAV